MKRLGVGGVVALIVFLACSGGGDDGGDGTGGTPPPTSGGGGGAGGGLTTLRLLPTGVGQTSINMLTGSTLTIINEDSVPHEMASDPHPTHTSCPQLNGRVLASGESLTLQVGSVGMSCGMHDHLNPGDTRFRAIIQIITGGTVGGGAGGGEGAGSGGRFGGGAGGGGGQ